MRTSTILVIFGCIIASSLASYAVKKTPTFKFDSSALNVEGTDKKASFGDLLHLFQTHDFQDNSVLHQYLDQLRSRVHDEHSEHLTIYNAQKAACKSEVEFRTNEIAAGQASFAASQTHLNLCTSEKLEAVSLKELAEAALVVYGQQLTELRDQREIQIQIYNSRKAKLIKAHDAIQTALGYVDELELTANNLGFGQTAQLVQITNTLLAVSVQTKQTNKVLPIYNKFLQVHNKQKFDIRDVEELRELFEQILSNVETAQQELDAQEALDLATFINKENALLALIAKLNDQVSLSATYITKMNNCIDQETSISQMADDKVKRNSDLLTHAQKLCEDNESEWTEGESARNHQLQLLDQLQWALDQLSTEYQEQLLDGADPYKQNINIVVQGEGVPI